MGVCVQKRMMETQLHAAQQALISAEDELQRTREREAALSGAVQKLEQRLDTVTARVSLLMCVSCTSSLRSVLFLPCLHVLYCTSCAVGSHVSTCASCGATITATLPFSVPAQAPP